MSASTRRTPRELPWLKRPLAELCRLSWPIAVSMLSYSVMNLVDTLFVARLGPGALAGVGMGGVVSFALLVFSMGLLRGVKVLVSQALGSGRKGSVGDFLAAGMLVAAALGAATVGVGQLVALALPHLSAEPQVGRVAATYLSIRILCAPVLLAFVAMRETVYGLGEARAPMVASVTANLLNAALAYLFIFRLDLGVAGAAWAAFLAQGVEAGVLFGLRAPVLRVQWRRGWAHLGALARVGLPTGLQMLIEVGSFTLLTLLIAAMSEADMAAHQIALQVVQFSFLPAVAVAEAGSVLAGQAVGADRDALVLGVARLALWLTGLYTGFCTLVLIGGASVIVRLFTGDAAVLAATLPLLHVAAAFQVADAANIVARGILRGTGDVRFPAIIGIAASWSLTPPLAWLLGMHLGLGALGGWIGLCAEIVATAGLFWWRLLGGGWRRAAARSRAVLAAEGAV